LAGTNSAEAAPSISDRGIELAVSNVALTSATVLNTALRGSVRAGGEFGIHERAGGLPDRQRKKEKTAENREERDAESGGV
jgi:hypothetical protein